MGKSFTQGNAKLTKPNLNMKVPKIVRRRKPAVAPTFHPFSRLPTELQLEIWEIYNKDTDLRHVMVEAKAVVQPRFRAITPVPEILHVCSRSREIGLKIYQMERKFHTSYFATRYFKVGTQPESSSKST